MYTVGALFDITVPFFVFAPHKLKYVLPPLDQLCLFSPICYQNALK